MIKPGALFGTYEFLMTPFYIPSSQLHNKIKHRIERRTGCHLITTETDVINALNDVSFDLVRAQGMAIVTREDSVPW